MFLPTIAYDTIIWKKQCIADTYAQSLFLGEFGNQIRPADAKIVSDKNTVFTSGKEKKCVNCEFMNCEFVNCEL